MRTRARYIPYSPPYLVFCVFGAALAVLLAIYGKWPSFHHASVIFAAVLMAVFAVFALLAQGRGVLTREGLARSVAMIADWLPFVLCISVYENLHDVTQLIRPDIADATLARIDEAIFGVQPSLYLQAIVSPTLTDYLAIAYTSYFVVPPLLAGYLYVRGHVEEFRRFQLSLLVIIYAGFFSYISVPAIGPRFHLAHEYTVPLTGAIYGVASEATNKMQVIARDCFPSLHTAISTLWLVTAIRLRRLLPAAEILLPIILVLTVSLWFSTVYLRYHWAIDVIAGWAHAALCIAAAGWIYRVTRAGARA